MKITLWGVRGSIPTPQSGKEIRNKIRQALIMARPGDISSEEAIEEFVDSLPFSVKGAFGGNTTCIEVRTDAEDLIIIDAGSGIRNLGQELMALDFGQGRGLAHILFTHTHWDHIQGIPFFVPFFIPGNVFNIYSPIENIRERLYYQQDAEHFPITLDYMQATKLFHIVQPDREFYINDAKITSKAMPHPGGAYGYRIENNGKVFVYTSDCEFNIEAIDQIDRYYEFFREADVLIFDTQYTFEESIDKMDYGHSHASIAIDIAVKAGAKKLVLFHHEPNYNDGKLENVLINARSYMNFSRRQKQYIDLEIDIAHEGMVMKL